mgnify:CR=1 FL=1
MLIYLETNMTNHGIISLSGFAFQIRVFIYYLSEISDGESLGYEVLDDIVLKNDNLDEIDTNIFVKGIPTFKAIQVKKSDLKQADMKKILKNWNWTMLNMKILRFKKKSMLSMISSREKLLHIRLLRTC